jgi:hypothetical protein
MAEKYSSQRTKAFARAQEMSLLCTICIVCTQYNNVEEDFSHSDRQENDAFPYFLAPYRWAYSLSPNV